MSHYSAYFKHYLNARPKYNLTVIMINTIIVTKVHPLPWGYTFIYIITVLKKYSHYIKIQPKP